jgi:hypothetical protein
MEDRYKFTRAQDPFKGLDDYFSSPEISVRNRRLTYPMHPQQDLPGYSYQAKLKESLGTFFEIIYQGIKGGKLKHHEVLSDQINLFTEREELICPDIQYGEGRYSEVKSVAKGQTLKLLNVQMKKYATLLRNGGNSSHPEISFEIFRHGITELLRRFRNRPLEDLVQELSSNVRYMFSLPPQIIFSIYNGGPYTSKYTGDRWDKCSQFLSGGMNSLLAYPEDTLVQLGLNPDGFVIEKNKFPKDITINGFTINPFPILIVKDKDYLGWLQIFRSTEETEQDKKVVVDPNTYDLPF